MVAPFGQTSITSDGRPPPVASQKTIPHCALTKEICPSQIPWAYFFCEDLKYYVTHNGGTESYQTLYFG